MLLSSFFLKNPIYDSKVSDQSSESVFFACFFSHYDARFLVVLDVAGGVTDFRGDDGIGYDVSYGG